METGALSRRPSTWLGLVFAAAGAVLAASPLGCGSDAEEVSSSSSGGGTGNTIAPGGWGGGGWGGAVGGGGGSECLPDELCDGEDNDCDGEVDEDCPCIEGDTQTCYSGDPQLVGLGACAEGIQTCTLEGAWGDCEGEVLPADEECDAIDNDCNGETDEGFGTITCGLGVCQNTVEACENGVGQPCIPGTPSGSGETCDGVDDDCDGQVDEGCACVNETLQGCYTGAPNTQNVGECSDGTQTCTTGQWGPCTGDVTPSSEQCDGLDNDCDSQVDENDPGGGGNCQTGLLGVCGPGTMHCTNGNLNCAQNVQATTELCNGLDDDCDGQTDENNPEGGAACDTGLLGACKPGAFQCQNGGLVCVQTAQPTAELCNGVDDDCDGGIDENNPQGGASCSTGQAGVCGPGTELCVSGAIMCQQNQPSGAELCDGLDNDCDGGTDEGDPGGGLVCNTGVPGPCADGVTQCSSGAIVCNQTVFPSTEICDGGTDNDCDGQTDEGCSCTNGQTQSCYNGPNGTLGVGLCVAGTQTCTGGAWGACVGEVTPATDTCDGLDNDCDGTADQGDPGGGQPCNSGLQGECAAGTTQCSGGAIVCNANNTPTAEQCDGLDNDCDGVVDDGNPGGGTSCNSGQSGVCAAGTTQCSSGTLICNANTSPSPEVCDGLDNDCDGGSDEGDPGGGQSCNTGVPGVCAPGVTQCSNGSVVCNQTVFPSTEVCDGTLDDDCDGTTDEGCNCVNGATQSCYSGPNGTQGVGECVAGTQTCVAGNWGTCAGEVTPTNDVCDGLDNDCDGTTDDGNPGGGQVCNTGLNGVCAAGTTQCSGGSIVCNPDNSPSAEVCDGLDNNCDGFIDEGDPGGGQSCSSGQLGVCDAGTTQCAGGSLTCNANLSPSPETCDGLDNDCDGGTDEGDPGGGLTCNTGIPGVCADGITQCTGGSVICSQTVFPTSEICDGGQDNDCDGQVDEGCSCTNGQTQSCYNGPNGTQGVGPCQAGTQTCSGGAWGACVGEVLPSVEVCNGTDDDCDGTVDDGNPGGGGACNTGVPGICATGQVNCVSGALQCDQTVFPIAEVCGNSLDDDCDGTVDNGCGNCSTNLALTATGTQSGGGTGVYGPANWNDGTTEAMCASTCGGSCFGWVQNTTAADGAWVQYDWASPVTIGSMYVDANACSGTCTGPGRTMNGGDVQYWNGSSWVTAQTFTGNDGDRAFNFATPITTTALRIFNIRAGTCGQNSNTEIYEWYVWSGNNCTP